MTAPVPGSRPPLSQAEQRTAQDLVSGKTVAEIAKIRFVSPHTVRARLYSVRRKLNCPHRCGLHVVLHYILTATQATVPRPSTPAPTLNETQMVLLHALTEHTTPLEVANAAGIAPLDVHTAIGELLYLARSRDLTDLVRQAHGWGLLASDSSRTAVSEVGR